MAEYDSNPPHCAETKHVCHVQDLDFDTWQIIKEALPAAAKRNSDRGEVSARIDLSLAERGMAVTDIVQGHSDFLCGVVMCIAQRNCPLVSE